MRTLRDAFGILGMILVFVFFFAARIAGAAPCAYWAEFASFENDHNGPKQAHTWVRYHRTGVESFVISLMPHPAFLKETRRGQKLRMWDTVPASNLSWEATVAFAHRNVLTVYPHGRYCITQYLYENARIQAGILNAGWVWYRVTDRDTRSQYGQMGPEQAINCMTANSQPLERHYGVFRHKALRGRAGTQALIEYLAGTGHLFLF